MQEKKQISNSKSEDSGAKLIFDNATLCSQLLRDYSGLDFLKNVRPEDIEDVTERFVPMFTEERNSDSVKKIRLNDADIFMALFEHKSEPDYNVAMQILRYMVLIWEEYAKQQEKVCKGITKRKDFKYPPILPVLYYTGVDNWTVSEDFSDKIALFDVFKAFTPDFKYHIINIIKYDGKMLMQKKDALSLIMLINQIRKAEDFKKLNISDEYWNEIVSASSNDVLEVLARVVAVMLRKQNVPEDDIQDVMDQIKERTMPDLFEGWEGFDVQEERRVGSDIHLINLICKKLKRDMEPEKIAEEVEESLEYVQGIIEVAQKYAPDYDAEKIREEYDKISNCVK